MSPDSDEENTAQKQQQQQHQHQQQPSTFLLQLAKNTTLQQEDFAATTTAIDMASNGSTNSNVANTAATGDITGGTSATKKTVKEKQIKHPDAPKRFKSAFIFFSEAKHKEIKAQQRQQKVPHTAKIISKLWRNLSLEEKSKWEEIAEQDKERYEVERGMYKGPWTMQDKELKNRKKKDEERPRKPASAYLSYANKKRVEVKEANPSITNKEISAKLSEMWKNAPDEERKIYKDKEYELRQQYLADIAIYTEKKINEEYKKRKVREDNAHHIASQRKQAKVKQLESSQKQQPVGKAIKENASPVQNRQRQDGIKSSTTMHYSTSQASVPLPTAMEPNNNNNSNVNPYLMANSDFVHQYAQQNSPYQWNHQQQNQWNHQQQNGFMGSELTLQLTSPQASVASTAPAPLQQAVHNNQGYASATNPCLGGNMGMLSQQHYGQPSLFQGQYQDQQHHHQQQQQQQQLPASLAPASYAGMQFTTPSTTHHIPFQQTLLNNNHYTNAIDSLPRTVNNTNVGPQPPPYLQTSLTNQGQHEQQQQQQDTSPSSLTKMITTTILTNARGLACQKEEICSTATTTAAAATINNNNNHQNSDESDGSASLFMASSKLLGNTSSDIDKLLGQSLLHFDEEDNNNNNKKQQSSSSSSNNIM